MLRFSSNKPYLVLSILLLLNTLSPRAYYEPHAFERRWSVGHNRAKQWRTPYDRKLWSSWKLCTSNIPQEYEYNAHIYRLCLSPLYLLHGQLTAQRLFSKDFRQTPVLFGSFSNWFVTIRAIASVLAFCTALCQIKAMRIYGRFFLSVLASTQIGRAQFGPLGVRLHTWPLSRLPFWCPRPFRPRRPSGKLRLICGTGWTDRGCILSWMVSLGLNMVLSSIKRQLKCT